MRTLSGAASVVTLVMGVSVLTTQAHAAPATLGPPHYVSTLVGPGLASMYPVDVSNDAQYYFVLDAGRYRVLAFNRKTHKISFQEGGTQGDALGQFGDARALSYDAANNELFVADTPNNRVEVFSFSPTDGFKALYQFGSKGSGPEQFDEVYGVAVDQKNGWVYAVDGAGRVEKSTLTGTYISEFGNGSLNEPRQVDVAPNGDVFVMNARDHECDVYSTSGSELMSFGQEGSGPGEFTQDPRGVAVSADGSLAFVTDSGGKRIEAFHLSQQNGQYVSASFAYTIPSGSGTAAFVGPRGVTATSDNHLLVADEWGFNLHEFSFTATSFTNTYNSVPTPPPVPGVDAPRGIRVAPNGRIYIVDYWNQRIEYMNSKGRQAKAWGQRGDPSQPGAINFAWDAAIQPSTGDVFLANRESDQIEVFTDTGTTLSIWGTLGTGAGQFHFPQGIAFGPDGTLYVADSANDRIERFSVNSQGVGTWMATYGTPGSGAPGELNTPTGIDVASDGTLWVADTTNSDIQSMTPGGAWSRYPTPIGSSQGFHVPWGVRVAPDGNIWVADTGNNRIVAMDPSGNFIFSATAASMGVPGSEPLTPFAVAFGTSGRVYLSDVWNDRVLTLSSSSS